MNGHPPPVSDDFGLASLPENVSMGSHEPIMHNALRHVKCLLRNNPRYTNRVSDPAERLRIARLRAGFKTGKDAAESMGIQVSTYLCHENGSRGIKPGMATRYAKKFKVSEQWLLYGVGEEPGSNGNMKAEIVGIFDRLPPLQRAEALGYLRALANRDN